MLTRTSHGVAALLLALSLGCFDFSPERFGHEGEPCFIEGVCRDGLVCKDDACVSACGPDICSGHGVCTLAENIETCACDVGYAAQGTECLGTSMVRVTHVGVDAGPIDIYIADEQEAVATHVEPATTRIVASLGPGSYRLELRAAGLPVSSPPFLTSPGFALVVDDAIEIILSGALRPTGGERAASLRAYPAAADKTMFVHCAQAGGVDVSIDALTQVLAIQPQEARAVVGPSGTEATLEVKDAATKDVLVERTGAARLFAPGRTILFFSTAERQLGALSLPPLPATSAELL